MLIRMSTLFLRTLREDPAEAEVPSHRLLVRAGYIRRAAPLGVGINTKGREHLRGHPAVPGGRHVQAPSLHSRGL